MQSLPAFVARNGRPHNVSSVELLVFGFRILPPFRVTSWYLLRVPGQKPSRSGAESSSTLPDGNDDWLGDAGDMGAAEVTVEPGIGHDNKVKVSGIKFTGKPLQSQLEGIDFTEIYKKSGSQAISRSAHSSVISATRAPDAWRSAQSRVVQR